MYIYVIYTQAFIFILYLKLYEKSSGAMRKITHNLQNYTLMWPFLFYIFLTFFYFVILWILSGCFFFINIPFSPLCLERAFFTAESAKSSWIFHESDGSGKNKGRSSRISSLVANIKISKWGKWKVEWWRSMAEMDGGIASDRAFEEKSL